MVKKGNAPVPNAHFHKHWNPTGSQKGHVRCFFKQGPQKKIRRARRQKKAAAVFPRPVKGPLRPIVHCKSQRFNMKTRLGRGSHRNLFEFIIFCPLGFTTLELKTAGLTDRRYARTIGISVDRRRRNHCEESLALNAERIKTYLSKLVLFPLKAGKKLPEGVTEEDIKNPVQSKQVRKQDLKMIPPFNVSSGWLPQGIFLWKERFEAGSPKEADRPGEEAFDFPIPPQSAARHEDGGQAHQAEGQEGGQGCKGSSKAEVRTLTDHVLKTCFCHSLNKEHDLKILGCNFSRPPGERVSSSLPNQLLFFWKITTAWVGRSGI